MKTDLLDLLKDLSPEPTPFCVNMLIKQGLSAGKAWDRYEEMLADGPYDLEGDEISCPRRKDTNTCCKSL